MSIGGRIFLGIIFGCAFAIILLSVSFNLETTPKALKILLWNVFFIAKLAGNGPVLGHDDQGNPIYEGTPVHLLFGLIGILSTFPYYSFIFFVIISIWDRLRPAKTPENTIAG